MQSSSVVIVRSSVSRKGKEEEKNYKYTHHSLQKLQTYCKKRKLERRKRRAAIKPGKPGEGQEEEGFTRRSQSRDSEPISSKPRRYHGETLTTAAILALFLMFFYHHVGPRLGGHFVPFRLRLGLIRDQDQDVV